MNDSREWQDAQGALEKAVIGLSNLTAGGRSDLDKVLPGIAKALAGLDGCLARLDGLRGDLPPHWATPPRAKCRPLGEDRPRVRCSVCKVAEGERHLDDCPELRGPMKSADGLSVHPQLEAMPWEGAAAALGLDDEELRRIPPEYQGTGARPARCSWCDAERGEVHADDCQVADSRQTQGSLL